MKILFDILNYFKNIIIDFDLLILADIQKETAKIKPDIIHADESEFFSRKEFAEIASALFYIFGFAKVFYSELEFMEYIFSKKTISTERIVYNFSRDGTKEGKKSLIPAFCDLYGLKYTGSNAFTISLLRNKWCFSNLLENNNICVPPSILVSKKTWNKLETFYGRCVIAKNLYESASQGMDINNRFFVLDDYQKKLEKLLNKMNCQQILVQEYIAGIECEVMVLQFKNNYYALDPIEIIFEDGVEFLDSSTSNAYTYSFQLLEKTLGLKTSKLIRNIAEQAATALMIKDYARFDFRIKDGQPYLIDIAGTPYTIRHSSVAYLFTEVYQLNYSDIYKAIFACCWSNYNDNN